MEENVKAPDPPASAAGPPEAYFFTAATFKLVVMSLVTFGLYSPYWFYKNWVLIKARTGQNILPFWRAFFSVLFAYSCFRQVRDAARQHNIPESLPIAALAVAFFLLSTQWIIFESYWWLSYFGVAVIIPVNSLAVRINEQLKPDFENNGKFTGMNWAGIVVAGLLFALTQLDDPFGLDEPPADVASPAKYEGKSIQFSYPRNWKVTEDSREEGFRFISVESPGSASLMVHVYPKQDAVSLRDFVEWFSTATKHESSLSTTTTSFSDIESSAFSPSKKGVREISTTKISSTVMSFIRDYYVIDTGDKRGFLITHAPEEDLATVKPGFDLILGSFALK